MGEANFYYFTCLKKMSTPTSPNDTRPKINPRDVAEAIESDQVTQEDLQKFERKYNEHSVRGAVPKQVQFEYAWCLVRSAQSSDVRKGVVLLEDIYAKGNEEEKRDYIYYLALGHTKLKDYQKAKKFIDAILYKEPNNGQALELKALVESKLVKDGLLGMALVGGGALMMGGAALLVGGIAAVAMAKKK